MLKGSPLRLGAAAALLVAALGALFLLTPWGHSLWPGAGNGSVGQAFIGGPFHLTDQDGRQRTDADFRGRYMLIYFGYTSCPDVCPTTLQTITNAMAKLGGDAVKVTPIFITVDPARDTPAVMKAYAANFDPRLIALTGSDAEIAAVAKAYRIYYAKVGEGANYSMDHSSIVYLMGPDGKYLGHFGMDATADDIAKGVRSQL